MKKIWLLVAALICVGCAGSSGKGYPNLGNQSVEDTTVAVDAVHATDAAIALDGGASDTVASEDAASEDTGSASLPEECVPSEVKPLPRSEMLGAYDAQRRKLVYFGGDNGVPVNCQSSSHPVGLTDLWVYDTVCATFESIPYTDGPPGRARGMAVYDPDRDQMVIFGGRFRQQASGAYTVYNDAWALDLQHLEWTKLQTTGPTPIARSNPAGAYNRLTQELMLFGGNSSNNGLAFAPHDDVWALNLETLVWREVPTSSPKPEPRLFHAAALDEEGDRLFIFGGGGANAWIGPFLGDLWVLDLATSQWQQLHSGGMGAPQGRIWSTITFDKVNNRVLLFGGHDDGNVGNNNDTWEFDLESNTWNLVVAPDTPSKPANGFCDFPPDFTLPNLDAPDRRQGHLAALDPIRGEWIVHGGKTDCGIIDDVWTFDLARDEWIRLFKANQGEACIRGDTPEMCLALCN